ncbi:MAG: PaaI family thioesterase [Aestuariibacter sp.]
MDIYLQKGREVLNSQAFSRMMEAELDTLSPGKAEMSLNIKYDYKQSYGFVHGGVISYMADNCLTFAGATYLGNCVTSEFKINYLFPAIGERLIATASVISHTWRQAVCECRLSVERQGQRSLVAAAQGTIVKVENDVTASGVTESAR